MTLDAVIVATKYPWKVYSKPFELEEGDQERQDRKVWGSYSSAHTLMLESYESCAMIATL